MNRPLIAAALALAAGTGAQAQASPDKQVELLLSLLPPDARSEATVLLPTDNGLAIHREGRNQFVCVGDVPGDNRFAIACYHESLEHLRSLERELSAQGLRGATFRERLCAEVAKHDAPVANGALELTASGVVAGGASIPDSMVVYQLLYFPHATEASIGIPDEELPAGAPWLHLAGTCQAHIMWKETRYFDQGSSQ